MDMNAFHSSHENFVCTQSQRDFSGSMDDWNIFLTPDDAGPKLPLDKPPTPVRPQKRRKLSTIQEDGQAGHASRRNSITVNLPCYFDGLDFDEMAWLHQKQEVPPTREAGSDVYVGERIGRGDFAEVLLSGSYLTSRVGKKALKKSRKQMLPITKGHFIREVQALARACGHPNIVPFHGGCIRPDEDLVEEHYIFTGLCDADIQSMIVDRQKFPERRLLSMVKDIASALSHIHSLGIVHMDIKPANIFAVKSDITNKEVFKLGDFGMATRLDGKGDVEQGTARYMDYEFSEVGWQLDKVDVYSLGVCICDMCMGGEASQFSQDLDIARGEGVPGLSAEFQQLAKDMLALKRKDRPSAVEVLDRTRAILTKANRSNVLAMA